MVEEGQNPFDIIYKIAEEIEKESGEPKFAECVKNEMRAVYGYVFGEVKLLTDELNDTHKQLALINERLKTGNFSEEITERINFAVNAHEKKIEELQKRIKNAENEKS